MEREESKERIIEQYRTVDVDGTGEVIEKKSRFICNLHYVESEEEAIAYIDSLKKQYWDARHNCYAYIIGKDGSTLRCSDDGEPSGTAGRPMLEVLKNEGLTNVVAVVTRYFGGTLLGTGGLLRAYTQAVLEGIKNACLCDMQLVQVIHIVIDYESVGKVKYCLASRGISCMDEEYGQNVAMQIAVPVCMTKAICNELTEVTNGRIKMEEKDKCYIKKMN